MRLGTRGSALALAQARAVAAMLGGAEIVTVQTAGDRGGALGDKSRWIGELERALEAGEIDIAVHSAKDLPGRLADGLELVGAPPRAAAGDVLCGVASLEQLAPGAAIGTSSLRRRAQLLAARADLEVRELRGNVDTRLARMQERGLAAIVLAAAGLERLGLAQHAGGALDPVRFVPAPGQGALGLQARGGTAAAAAAAAVCDPVASACLTAERALSGALGASCNTPLGAHAVHEGSEIVLRAWAGLPDGSEWLLDELSGAEEDPAGLGSRVAERMQAAGAGELLERAETMAAAG